MQVIGGEEGIRTLVTIAREHAFQAGALKPLGHLSRNAYRILRA